MTEQNKIDFIPPRWGHTEGHYQSTTPSGEVYPEEHTCCICGITTIDIIEYLSQHYCQGCYYHDALCLD